MWFLRAKAGFQVETGFCQKVHFLTIIGRKVHEHWLSVHRRTLVEVLQSWSLFNSHPTPQKPTVAETLFVSVNSGLDKKHQHVTTNEEKSNMHIAKKNEEVLAIGLVIVATMIVLIIGINAKSLWIDECLVYRYINFPNAKEVLKTALDASGSEKQMPLFLLFAWVWSRIFGLSEIAMRSVNVLPAFLYTICGYKIANIVCKKKQVWLGTMFFLLNPIFIAYLNEARPYIALLAFALITVYNSFYEEDFNSRKNIISIHVFLLLGISFHLLFVFSFCIYICGILYHYKSECLKLKMHIKGFLYFLPLYIILLGYMAFTFYYSSSSSIGHTSGSVIASLVVSIYYILGYGGLGPSRNDLRSPSISTLTPVMMILIATMSVILVLFAIALIRGVSQKPLENRPFWLLTAGVLLVICFCLLSIVFHYSFWERHIISLSSIFIVLILEVISTRNMRYMAFVLLFLFAVSSMNFRFNYYYGNEDYKSMVNDLSVNDYIVMAQASDVVLEYYGKQFVQNEDFTDPDNQVININNYSFDQVNELVRQYTAEYSGEKLAIVLTSRTANDKCQLYHQINSFGLPNETVVEYRGLRCIMSE